MLIQGSSHGPEEFSSNTPHTSNLCFLKSSQDFHSFSLIQSILVTDTSLLLVTKVF